LKNINTPKYWDKKWADKKTGGKYGENQYYFLENYLPKDEYFTVLDVACGNGNGIAWLSGKYKSLHFCGIDFSEFVNKKKRGKFK